MSPLEREQISDSVKWARFQGVGELSSVRPVAGLIQSVWVSLTIRHGFTVLDTLRRLIT